MNEKFVFDGKIYKVIPVKDGEKHCEKCAFYKYRECEYVAVIPECDSYMRDDGKDVYFIQARSNFDRITVSPEALAEESVYLVYDKYSDGTEWMSVFINGTWRSWEEAVAATLEWLKKEKEE